MYHFYRGNKLTFMTNAIYIAGTYDATICGVYGDTTSEESSREIIPLLKQLIAMLERGSTFTLSADLIQAVQGGTNTVTVSGGEDGGSGGDGNGDDGNDDDDDDDDADDDDGHGHSSSLLLCWREA